MVTNYETGRRFEYWVANIFNKQGYVTARSAGSHGAWDVIAINKEKILLIQCKTTKRKLKPREIIEVAMQKYFSKDIKKLQALEVPSNVEKYMAIKFADGEKYIERVDMFRAEKDERFYPWGKHAEGGKE